MRSSTPSFSILTPTLDRPEQLEAAVASVLAQSHGDWELVVYDVGEDAAVLPDDPRIRLSRGNRRGPAADFQSCLELATGAIVTPLADDDTLPPHALETAWGFFGHEWGPHRMPYFDGHMCRHCGVEASNTEVGKARFSRNGALCEKTRPWLVGRTVLVDAKGEPVAMRGGNWDSVQETRRGMYWLGGAVYWRKSLSDRVGGFDSDFDGAADFDLYRRFIADSEPALCGDVLYIHNIHPGQDTNVNRARQADATHRIMAA